MHTIRLHKRGQFPVCDLYVLYNLGSLLLIFGLVDHVRVAQFFQFPHPYQGVCSGLGLLRGRLHVAIAGRGSAELLRLLPLSLFSLLPILFSLPSILLCLRETYAVARSDIPSLH